MLGITDRPYGANQKVLRMNPDNAYANKGMGLTLYKLGNVEKGIKLLKRLLNLVMNILWIHILI